MKNITLATMEEVKKKKDMVPVHKERCRLREREKMQESVKGMDEGG